MQFPESWLRSFCNPDLTTQQLADLTAAISAQGRAQSIEAARNAATEAEGRERFRRFRTRN